MPATPQPQRHAAPGADARPLSKRRLKTWIRLLRLTRSVESDLRDFLRTEHDTTLPRFDVMAALYRRREDVTMSELSRMLLVSNGNATAVVDRLEKDGFATRTPAPGDRRTIHVALTDAGITAFEAMAKGHEAKLDTLLGGLTAEDLDQLRGILMRALPDTER
ncbi:MAG: MarR family transcriptional regulator [Rhodobacter sp.]|nr:MarR family transcriptional regulator [Paracoccaceae bacterium]MCB1408297.1 MarR family transcriptional regulator [Paracoccaceae bacterium]MCC0079998.1 MarR family transcriptional regulator [Rhodobacter sp.]